MTREALWDNMKSKKPLNIHGIIGIAVLVVAQVMLFKRVEPFVSWFYGFAWWSYILIVDSIIYRLKGDSLILSRTREFFLMVCWSFTLWFFFEMVNLVMRNWYYINVPNSTLVRFFGYGMSYGTVLPALFETTELLERLGLFRNAPAPRFRMTSRWSVAFLTMGGLFLVLPMLIPRYTFPLIWGSFIFLLEPINYRFGGRSLLAQWERGSLRTFYVLLVSGLICGGLWEFWNFWARTKWVYTVPFFDELKLFEMPLLGFLGFPPFVVECYVIYNFISLFRHGRGWQQDAYRLHLERKTSRGLKLITILGIALFYIVSTRAVDRHTIHSTVPLLDNFPHLSVNERDELKGLRIATAWDLVDRTRRQEEYERVLTKLGFPSDRFAELVRQARLITLKGLGIDSFLSLQEIGIESVEMLAQQNPEGLHDKLERLMDSGSQTRLPSRAETSIWIREARRRRNR